MQDCIRLFNDSVFSSRDEIIREAYAMSKMTVVCEQDKKQARSYENLQFVEFLEFLARVVDLTFQSSELEEIPLEEKLEYLLKDLLPMVGMTYQVSRQIIMEFSDSDDDY